MISKKLDNLLEKSLVYAKSVDLILSTLIGVDGIRNLYSGISTGNEGYYQGAVLELGFSAWRVCNYLIERRNSKDLEDLTKRLKSYNQN